MEPQGLRVLIGNGPPRLCRLARARADALSCPTGSPDVTVYADPAVVLEEQRLHEAAEQARRRRIPLAFSARTIDGVLRPGAATVVAAGADRADAMPTPQSVGTWLSEPGDLPASTLRSPVSIFSHAFGATGYAAVGRGLALGLRRVGVDVRLVAEWGDMGDPGLRAEESAELRAIAGPPRRDDPAVLIRPPLTPAGKALLSDVRATRVRGPAAAYTMFECDGVPQRWIPALREFEQVWVPTRFNRATFAAAGIPEELLHVVPIGIDAPRYAYGEPDFPLPERRRHAFLSVFDWNERKGPDVLLRAWATAFDADDDVVLYLRTGASTVGTRGGPLELARELGLDPTRMAPIVVLGADLPADRYEALFRSVDAFVLTSRGEAFCIPLLEAMAAGIPAIGTVYGGSSEFLDATTGYPVPARLVPVAAPLASRIPFYADQRWADPSVEATAKALRSIVDDPADALRRASAGFVRAQLAFDRRETARIAARTLATMPSRRRSVRGVTAAIVSAPIRDGSASAHAGRALAAALAREEVVVRIEDVGAALRADDGDATRRIREQERVVAQPRTLRLSIDAFDPRADVIVFTADPAVGELRRGVELWTADPALRDRLIARGVPADRVRHVPFPLDVDLWSPDVRSAVGDPPLVAIGGEPGWIDAATAVLRVSGPSRPIRILVRGGGGTPAEPRAIASGIQTAIAAAANGYVPHVTLLGDALAPLAHAATLGSATLVAALDVDAVAHDAARACGVPVVDVRDARHLVALLGDSQERLRLAHAQRAEALARAALARRTLREAVEALAPQGEPLTLPLAPVRIALHLTASIDDADAVVARLRERATHEIVDAGTPSDYVAELDGAYDVSPGWDETLINALEANATSVVRAQRYDELVAADGGVLPPYATLAEGGFLTTRDGGHAEPVAGAGLRLRRERPRATALPAFVVYGALVGPAPLLVTRTA